MAGTPKKSYIKYETCIKGGLQQIKIAMHELWLTEKHNRTASWYNGITVGFYNESIHEDAVGIGDFKNDSMLFKRTLNNSPWSKQSISHNDCLCMPKFS